MSLKPLQYVYDFAQGSREMRNLLGGKGANVAEMTRILGSERVPAGFTITTEACVAYMHSGKHYPDGLAEQIQAGVKRLELETGKKLGDAVDPLLVSVRSGARESMPGMLDTVLNLGLNDKSVQGLIQQTTDERFAWDSYRRFVQMFANVVHGVPNEELESIIRSCKDHYGVKLDTELKADALRELTGKFQKLFTDVTGFSFPQKPEQQLEQAICAVFDSWGGERAIQYRRIHRIPDDWGTAVNVQQMVFGNRGKKSASGVAFSRDELTGASSPSGDFLINAQGEDVVSGVRNTSHLQELQELMPQVYSELLEILNLLEHHYQDMQDVEFTIEEGKLYMLQTRNAKRPAKAAVRFAVDAVEEGLLTKEQAIQTIDAAALDALLHPTFDTQVEPQVLARGVGASPGAAKGELVFTATDAVAAAQSGRTVILARPFTEADDVAGFHAARGILTSEGGKASHAALVARGMGRPCVCGASALDINPQAKQLEVDGVVIREGEYIAIDGTTGIVTTDDVPLVEPEMSNEFLTVLSWCDQLRRLEVRTNADTPQDAEKARQFGAQGIGLCRTEHMFMEADRQPKMRAMILAATVSERRKALDELLPLQQRDFEEIFAVMSGLPVTIRLLDPPLHEFLPKREELEREILQAKNEDNKKFQSLQKTLDRVHALEEVNPMLGTRGCRLGILYPEIYEMQVRAMMRAAQSVRKRDGASPLLEVMIPLVDYEQELQILRKLVIQTAESEGMFVGKDFSVGTMVELPRAALVADRVAVHADFFSFGTNDLTQTTLGFSRDDIEGKILSRYIDLKILDRSPFETIDVPGVGEIVRLGAERGRSQSADLKLGVCGEHGGDPDSISFFEEVGMDYVSCSPYRVPIARVAAAQAAINVNRCESDVVLAHA